MIALVGSAVLSDGDTCVSRADLNVEVRIAYAVSNLLVSSACRKHSEGGCEYSLAGRSDTCRNAHHIALCDSAIEESLRELFLKHTRLGSRRKICVEHQKIILFAKVGKRLAVAFSSCLLICHVTPH